MTYAEFRQARKIMNHFVLPIDNRETLSICGKNFNIEIKQYNHDLFERMVFIIGFNGYEITIKHKREIMVFKVITYSVSKEKSCYDKGKIEFSIDENKTIRENLMDFFEEIGFDRNKFLLHEPEQLSFLQRSNEGRDKIAR